MSEFERVVRAPSVSEQRLILKIEIAIIKRYRDDRSALVSRQSRLYASEDFFYRSRHLVEGAADTRK